MFFRSLGGDEEAHLRVLRDELLPMARVNPAEAPSHPNLP